MEDLSLPVRAMAPDEVPQACALFKAVFAHDRLPSDWRWKYEGSASFGHAHAVVACPRTGRLLGHAGAVVFEGRLGQAPIRVAQVMDVMVHPEVRSDLGPGNLYRRLMQTLRPLVQRCGPVDQPLFVHGFPGERPARLGERMGFYRRLSPVFLYDYTAAPRRFIAPWSWRITPFAPASLTDGVLGALADREATLQRGPVLRKRADYLRWRYLQHPGLHYTLWQLLDWRRRVAGWMVACQPPLAPQATLIDACLPPDLSVRDALDALARASGVGSWRTWLPVAGVEPVLTPFVPVEIASQAGTPPGTQSGFHPDWPLPRFQPGDTDVF